MRDLSKLATDELERLFLQLYQDQGKLNPIECRNQVGVLMVKLGLVLEELDKRGVIEPILVASSKGRVQ